MLGCNTAGCGGIQGSQAGEHGRAKSPVPAAWWQPAVSVAIPLELEEVVCRELQGGPEPHRHQLPPR
eukprot:1594311-Prorocentrum_lima.AAC.1